MAWMYLLICCDGSYYAGSTTLDPEHRAWQHNHDDALASVHTRKRRPVALVHVEQFATADAAFAREKQVQKWSRAKKTALIEGRTDDLQMLAASRTAGPSTSSGTSPLQPPTTPTPSAPSDPQRPSAPKPLPIPVPEPVEGPRARARATVRETRACRKDLP